MSGFDRAKNITIYLERTWHELMNDCSARAQGRAEGIVDAFRFLGDLSAPEAEGWKARFDRCPQAAAHQGGRHWCAYCGDVKKEIETEDTTE